MKKSTVRLAVVSACEGAGLVLSGSGGGSDGTAIGYASADEAASTLETNASSLDACSDITVTVQDMELSTSTVEVDAEVEGADQVVATETSMDMSGQEMTTTTVQVLKGSAIVSVTGTSTPGAEEAPGIDDLSATAADMIAALP